MSYVSFQTINSLEEISFMGGSTYTIIFDIYDENSIPVDSVLSSLSWKMFYYGQPGTVALTKSGVYTPLNRFTVTLTSADTQGLSGKFIHQAVITDYNGNTYKPAQGTILIVAGA